MPKDLFAEDTLGAYDYDIIQPAAPDPCAALRKQLMKLRPNTMVGVSKHRDFMTNIGSEIIGLGPTKGLSFYGTLFVVTQAALETQYGTNYGSTINNYWGHKDSYGKSLDYSNLTFSESVDKYLDNLQDHYPDMLTLIKSSTTVGLNILPSPVGQPPLDYDYYFTGEEVNQGLNSGTYGGNGWNGRTPKILKDGVVCYNAELYDTATKKHRNYGPHVMGTLNTILRLYFMTVREIRQLSSHSPPCEPDVPALTDPNVEQCVLSVQFNVRKITGKNYGYYMPNSTFQAGSPINPIINSDGESVQRPYTDISNRIKIPNSKGVTVPDPID